MDSMKSTSKAFSTVKEISELSGVEITNEMSYDEIFKSCVEKMKLEIQKSNLGTVIKLINFFRRRD